MDLKMEMLMVAEKEGDWESEMVSHLEFLLKAYLMGYYWGCKSALMLAAC